LREIEISRKGLLRDMKGRNLAELRQAVNLNASQMGGQRGKIGRIFFGSPCSSRKKG
jgi:hypothetical protein